MDQELENFIDGLKESVQRYLYAYLKERDKETYYRAGQDFLSLFQEMHGKDLDYGRFDPWQQEVAKRSMGIKQ